MYVLTFSFKLFMCNFKSQINLKYFTTLLKLKYPTYSSHLLPLIEIKNFP